MHILYIHQYFCPPDGSGGTRSYGFAKRLVAAGHEVTIITSSAFFPARYGLNSKVEKRELDGIRLHVLGVTYSNLLPYRSRMFAFIRFALGAAVVAMKMKRVDVVFATSTPLTIAIPGVLSARRHRVPFVFEVRDLWPELPIAMNAIRHPVLIGISNFLEKFAYRASERVVALSPGIKDGITRTGYPAERITVIPNACDVGVFRVEESKGKEFLEGHPEFKGGSLLVYTGTIGPINGLTYLVEIAEHILRAHSAVKFLVVGDGRERDTVKRLARERGVFGKNLWFMNPVPKEEVASVLSAATAALSLFVDLPAMWNNSANKFFDALAAGRPVIINYRGWQADIVEREGVGLVIPPADASKATREIIKFCRDKNAVEIAREKAALLADGRFNRDILAAKFADVLVKAEKREHLKT